MNILGISGSIKSQKTIIAVETVLQAIKNKDESIQTELISLGDFDIAYSDGRDYRDYEGDTSVVISKIMAADAFIIGTPVYQSSIPGVLKNLFDLLPKDAFIDKVVGIVTTAGSDKHFLMVESQLKPILNYMKAIIVPKYVFINEALFIDNKIVSDDIEFRVKQLADDAVNVTEVVQELKKKREEEFDF
jgi:FMN reductase